MKFIDFKIGENSGYVRFEDSEAAQKARAASVLSEQGGLVVKNYVAALEPVTGRFQFPCLVIFKVAVWNFKFHMMSSGHCCRTVWP